MKRIALSLVLLGIVGLTLVGCRASGEIGDTVSQISGAR
jgi:hypothetical protein